MPETMSGHAYDLLVIRTVRDRILGPAYNEYARALPEADE